MELRPIALDPVEILVVGLGPVGATIGNLLGRYGVKAMIVDKALGIFEAPRAITLDNEALRILQMAGLEEGSFDIVRIPRVRMNSPYFGEFAVARSNGEIDGHPKLVTFYQPQLEKVLRERLNEYPCIDVATGVEVSDFAMDSDGIDVELTLADGRPATVRTKYLIGADGANSTVRQKLGLGYEGKSFPQDWLIVDAKGDRPAIDDVEFCCDPKRPWPHMIAPGGRERWEFMLVPGESREEMERPEKVNELLAPWGGADSFEIERTAVYRFHARVAETFAKGRIFLAGDAAHISPPFAGQGLVAGLRDAANLCWKLTWVLRHGASPAILGSYDQERRPHARAMINFAQFMGRLVMPRNRLAAFVTHGLMLLSRYVPGLRDAFAELKVKPKIRLKRGLTAMANGMLECGALFPQVRLRSVRTGEELLSDDLLGGSMALVGFGVDPALHLDTTLAKRWASFGGSIVEIMPLGVGQSSPGWEDATGSLTPGLVPTGWAAIVRPDRITFADGPVSQAAKLVNQLLEILGAGAAGPGGHAVRPRLEPSDCPKYASARDERAAVPPF